MKLTFVLSCSADGKSQEGGTDAESVEALTEKLQGVKEQLASSRAELEELKEQMRLGVLSIERGEGDTAATGGETPGGSGAVEEGPSQDVRQLKARVTELEAELAERRGEAGGESSRDSDTIRQLTEKVEELQAALAQKESAAQERKKDGEGEETVTEKCLRDKVAELEAALAESRTSGKEGGAAGDGDQVRRLQEHLAELEGQLRKSVPRSELEEVQVTLGLQCEQLARERADVARRLNDALLDLERLRPPPSGDDEDEEEEEEQSVCSEPSVISGVQLFLGFFFSLRSWLDWFHDFSDSLQSEHSRRSLAAVREELEAARQEAAQALDCLCAEREGRAQDALQLKDAVPLSKHKEALSAVSEQLAQTLQELQEERTLRGQADERAARVEAKLQTTQDAIPKEEHEKVKVCFDEAEPPETPRP